MHTFAELMKSQGLIVDRVHILDRYENFFCWDQSRETSESDLESQKSDAVQYIEENKDTLKSLGERRYGGDLRMSQITFI